MKNISIIGVGRLGLCLALNLEKKGSYIIGVDINKDYIDSLNSKTFQSSEEGVMILYSLLFQHLQLLIGNMIIHI